MFTPSFDYGLGLLGTPSIVGTTTSGGQTTSADAPFWQVLGNWGVDLYKSTRNADLAEYQVSHGQVPTQNATGSLLGANAAGLGSVVVIVLVLVIVFKLLGGLLK